MGRFCQEGRRHCKPTGRRPGTDARSRSKGGSGGRLQAIGRQLLDAAAVADQARVVERQFTADLAFEDGLELAVVDLAVRADGILEHFRGDRVLGVGQVDGAGGEVDAEGDQAGDDIEQQADGVEGDDGRIDATVDLAASLG